MKKVTFTIVIWVLTCVHLFAAEHGVRISGMADFLKAGDSVLIIVSPYSGSLSELKSSFTVSAKEGGFALDIPAYDKPRFIQVRFNDPAKKMIGPFLIFPGDDLDFCILDGKTKFNGRSAESFQVQQELESSSVAYRSQFKIIYAPEALPTAYDRIDSCARICLQLLESRKVKIGEPAFSSLRNDIIARAVTSKLGYLTYTCLNRSAEVQDKYISALRKYEKPFNSYPSFVPADSSGVAASRYSAELLYQQYLVDSCILVRRKFNLHDCYLYESRNFKGEIREELLTGLFIMKRNNPQLSATDITGALGYVSNPRFRAELEKIRSLNTAGAVAPDFILQNENNKPVQLKDFRGKVVIMDFWFTGCGACKALAPTLYKLEKKYEQSAVVFLSVSIDRSHEGWLATLKSNDYASPLAVRLFTEGKGDRHQVIRDFNIHGYPTIIIIDKEGKICPRAELTEEGLSGIIDRFLR